MSWYASLRAEADPIWEAIHEHPFLRELGEGSLDVGRFRFYILQDYPYLKEFSRVLALAVSRGGPLEEMSFFAGLLQTTLTVEMALHRSYCREFGITDQDLEAAELAPTAHAYTRHLLSIGALGSQAEMTIALLPCVASYAEIGRVMGKRPPDHAPLYARWIEAYASEGYQEIARAHIALADRLEGRVGPEEKARCRRHFIIGSRYEWLFWEMAYRKEAWPVGEGIS